MLSRAREEREGRPCQTPPSSLTSWLEPRPRVRREGRCWKTPEGREDSWLWLRSSTLSSDSPRKVRLVRLDKRLSSSLSSSSRPWASQVLSCRKLL